MADRYDQLLAQIEQAVKELREMSPRQNAATESLMQAIEEAIDDHPR